MKTMRLLLVSLICWVTSVSLTLAYAGMPNFLMWIGKDQDALIIGEIVRTLVTL